MYPELFTIGNFSISSFGFMIAVSFLAGYWLISLETTRKKLDEKVISNMFLAAMIGGIVGAKLLYVFENIPFTEIVKHPITHLFARGGLTFYGGFIGAAVLVWIIAKRNKISMWTIGDLGAPAIALAYSIGRIGCLLVGDDYGVPSDLPWAIAFPNGSPPIDIPVHPTQAYEIIIMFFAFLLIWNLRTRVKPAGWLFSIYLITAGLERFFIEFLRNTTPSPIPYLSIAQVTAIGLIVIGAAKLYKLQSAIVEEPSPAPQKKFKKKKKA